MHKSGSQFNGIHPVRLIITHIVISCHLHSKHR